MTETEQLSIPAGPAFDALAERLIGRTITNVASEVVENVGWTDHGHVTITLDNGIVITCGGWGHDAWGPSIFIQETA